MGYDMYDIKQQGDGSYFRLNIWGMGSFREHMLATEMAFEDAGPPPWPEACDYGIELEAAEAVQYPDQGAGQLTAMSPETKEKAHRYLADADKVLRWHGSEVPGIPVHKFGTNDGWIVTPIECKAAVEIWRRNGSQPLPDNERYWQEWIGFLERAISRDGFEVH